MSEEESPEDQILMFITESGFSVVPIKAIIDALAEMEDHIKTATGLSQEELDDYLQKVEDLVGRDEAMHLELDEIISWIRAVRGY